MLKGGIPVVMAVWLAWALPVAAARFPDTLSDPLLTRPPVLETGVALPGDPAPPPCPVQNDLKQPLPLAEAADLALCHNPRIRAAWAEIKVQAGALGEARAAYLPTLTGSVSRLDTRTAYPGSSLDATEQIGNTAYAGLFWRLFDFGGRSAGRQAAETLLEAALASHEATLQQVLGETVQAWFDALTARSGLEARSKSEALARETLAAVEKREAKGAAAQGDSLQAGAALARATLARQRAEGEYRKAVALLVQVLGLAPGSELRLPDDEEIVPGVQEKALKDWLAVAEAGHPAIRAARAQWRAAHDKILVVRSEAWPTVDFSANYYQNGYPGQGLQATRSQVTTLGLSLSVPLFDGFSRTYKVQGAQAQAEAKEAELADTEHRVLTEVVKAQADALSSLGNLKASEDLLRTGEAALASSKRRFDKGAADILEMLNAESVLAEARMDRVRCLAEWRAARLKLLAAAGRLNRATLAGEGATETRKR